MSPREERECGGRAGHRSFSGFLRSLLVGVPWSERAQSTETLELAAPAGGMFRVHNSNGRTEVKGEDRSDILVTASKCARAESTAAAEEMLGEIRLSFAETPDGLDLDVEVPRKWNRRGSANLCIRLPREMTVWVAAANGRVSVDGIHGPVRAKSTNGSATVSNVVGNVEVATTNAKVSCACICGKLTARSSNGKIEIDEHRGSVDASTSNGLIRASFDGLGKGGAHLATSNGRIVLDLPEEVDADVDVRVDNGVIRNDRTLQHTTRQSNGRVVGRLGNGGALVKLRTSNGSISVR